MPQRLPSYEAPEGHEESTSPKNEKQDEKNKWRLRGLLWRMQLGVLPSPFDSVESLRRASADGRRRYADLRRRLLVDPHLMEEGQKPPDVGVDNPLSLDPDSVWGKYFRNVEIETIIDKDLSRLYPEHGNFFQGSGCQAMFRRILLVWALIHPQLSYRQGMHELLAPLLYVLHMDVLQLSQIKKRYEDLFDDRFDEDGYKSSRMRLPFEVSDDQSSINGHRETQAIFEHDELNIDLKVIVMGSDTYGAEGELGALFSARFMEHDAYCMFDALLSGRGGAVRMVEYFATSGVPDASAALFRTLAAADFALYAHLVELGVQPQYFALRWLRLLFGREFVLEDLLLVWDVIFSASNEIVEQQVDGIPDFSISERSAIISAIAVSLLLHSRAALLAAPDATDCLQRLLNFPYIQDVRTFLENAKLLQPIALAAASTPPPPVAKSNKKSPQKPLRQTSASCSPEVLKMFLSAEGYWEGKWKDSVLQKASTETVPDAASKSRQAKRTPNGSTKPVRSSSNSATRTPAPEEAAKSDDEPGEVQGKANVNSDSDEAVQDRVVNREDGSHPIQENRVDEKVVNRGVISDTQRSPVKDVQKAQGVAPERQRSAVINRVGRESNRQDEREPDDKPGEASRQPTVVSREVVVGVERSSVDEQRSKSVDSRDRERSTAVNNRDGERPKAIKEEGKRSKPGNKEIFEDGRQLNRKNATNNGSGALHEVVSIDDPLGVSSSSRPSTPNIEGEELMNPLKRVSSRSDFSDSPKKGKAPVCLQSLGQAMSEHIQVLEGVLSQKGEQMSKVVGGKGHVSAMVALAELRKISNALLQM